MAGFALLIVVLIPISTRGRNSDNRCACGTVKRNYADPAYRRGRALANAIEMAPAFIGATLAAVMVGASPFWVNLLAAVFLLSRMAMAIVHIRTEIQPLRSALWAVGMFCVVGLALFAFIGAF